MGKKCIEEKVRLMNPVKNILGINVGDTVLITGGNIPRKKHIGKKAKVLKVDENWVVLDLGEKKKSYNSFHNYDIKKVI